MNTSLPRFDLKETPTWICGGRVYCEGLGFGTVIGYKHGEINSRVYLHFDSGEKRSVKANTGEGMHDNVVFYVHALPPPAGWKEVVWPMVWFACGMISAVGALSGRLW